MTSPFLVVLAPHFAPDTAPTGEVMTTLVKEFVAAGQRVHVVTSLPWYRSHKVEDGWQQSLIRREITPWGSIIRVHPFAGKDKTNLLRRALGFALFSLIAGVCTLFAGGIHRRPRAVVAMSPPLTMGLTGWLASRLRRSVLVFNIQDIFPDAAVATGAITNKRIIAMASWLERVSYQRSDAVVVLSEDLKKNVSAKLSARHQAKIHVIANFVESDRIVPQDRMTSYRRDLEIDDRVVVMYAGNVGFSQSLHLMLDAAQKFPAVAFVINGDGSARVELERQAQGMHNVIFCGYQPRERVSEVLASADIHLVLLKQGLGSVSVPSKTYSILAAGRPVVASIDQGTEVTRILESSGAGVVCVPDSSDALVEALDQLISQREVASQMGLRGRRWVEEHVSPAVVAHSYLELINRLSR